MMTAMASYLSEEGVRAFEALQEHIDSLVDAPDETADLRHSLVIECPDCGKQVAFRGACPKCGGRSWVPAGHAGGITEQLKLRRSLQLVTDEE